MNFPVELHEHIELLAAQLQIQPSDIADKHARGHGHGGQNLNKATNCVELTHTPTGITVRYQHHRGLQQNRKEAYELLILKIDDHLRGVESELGKKRHKVERQKQRRSRRAKEKMLEEKRLRGEIKETRKDIV